MASTELIKACGRDQSTSELRDTADKLSALICTGHFPFQCESKFDDANFPQNIPNIKDFSETKDTPVFGFLYYCIQLLMPSKQADLDSKTILAVNTFSHSVLPLIPVLPVPSSSSPALLPPPWDKINLRGSESYNENYHICTLLL